MFEYVIMFDCISQLDESVLCSQVEFRTLAKSASEAIKNLENNKPENYGVPVWADVTDIKQGGYYGNRW